MSYIGVIMLAVLSALFAPLKNAGAFAREYMGAVNTSPSAYCAENEAFTKASETCSVMSGKKRKDRKRPISLFLLLPVLFAALASTKFYKLFIRGCRLALLYAAPLKRVVLQSTRRSVLCVFTL